MFDWLFDMSDAVRSQASRVEVECMTGADRRSLVRIIDEITRPLMALRAQAIGVIANNDEWNDGTSRTAEEWVAKTTGVSYGEAIRTVELGTRLAKLPDTARAFTEGRISETQAVQVARGGAADPHAEGHLLQTAQHGTVKHLVSETKRVIARATDHAQDEQDRVHRSRLVRHHVAWDGAFCLEARLTKVAGAKVRAALEKYAGIEFQAGRAAGRHEAHETYMADGLVAMCETAMNGASTGSGPLALVEVRVDHAALVRGAVDDGEVCEIEGIGPIPIAEAQRLASDCILRTLLVNGGVVQKISNITRSIPPRLRRAIEDRDRTCVVPGCDVSWRLEIDHRVPFAEGGRSDEENLARLCHEHHRMKTAGKAILERYEDEHGKPHWAWHPTSRPNEPRPASFEELWPHTGTG